MPADPPAVLTTSPNQRPTDIRIRQIWRAVRGKGLRSWSKIVLIALLAVLVNGWLEEHTPLYDARNQLTQKLLEWNWRPLEPRFVKLVLIRDVEYWQAGLAGRVPLKRDYLARIVDGLSKVGAYVIALDFDLQLPNPMMPNEEFPDYHEESLRLARSIVSAAEHHKVVLPVTVGPRIGNEFYLEAHVLQLFGLCSRPTEDGRWEHDGTPDLEIDTQAAANISCGFVEPFSDSRVLPVQLPGQQGTRIDSFALAILRARDPTLARELASYTQSASYLPRRTLKRIEYPAGPFFKNDDGASTRAVRELNGQTVIVGAGWHSLAYGRGALADLQKTPVGVMLGAEMHANFAEALADSRTYRHVPGIQVVLEWFGALSASFLLVRYPGRWISLRILIYVTAAMVLLEWVTLNTFGVFLEVFIPAFALLVHWILDGVFDGMEHGRD